MKKESLRQKIWAANRDYDPIPNMNRPDFFHRIDILYGYRFPSAQDVIDAYQKTDLTIEKICEKFSISFYIFSRILKDFNIKRNRKLKKAA